MIVGNVLDGGAIRSRSSGPVRPERQRVLGTTALCVNVVPVKGVNESGS